MGCSTCKQSNPCGCNDKRSCDDCPIVDWVPNTSATIGVTHNGCTDTLDLCPGIKECETKTHMTQHPVTGCIEYQNEQYVASDGKEGYVESICPSDIAKYINLEDLANVENAQPDQCGLLTYRKESNCGSGCTGASDVWSHWYAKDNLSTGINYVAGFNEEGCMEALDMPDDPNKYWFGMWRPGKAFGYENPEMGELPRTENGDPIVMSVDANGKPVLGSINLSCVLNNVVTNLATEITSSWRVIQSTPGFTASVNVFNGVFTLTWNDWGADGHTKHYGTGVINGQLNFSRSFDINTGNTKYIFHSVYYDKIVYTADHPLDDDPDYLTLKALTFGTAREEYIVNHMQVLGRGSFTENLKKTIDAHDYTITVKPGQKVGPIDFCYIYVDWKGDDEGYLQLSFGNKFTGWNQC